MPLCVRATGELASVPPTATECRGCAEPCGGSCVLTMNPDSRSPQEPPSLVGDAGEQSRSIAREDRLSLTADLPGPVGSGGSPSRRLPGATRLRAEWTR